MATICFDIKRVNNEYVCIEHCNIDVFEYEHHLPFSFYPRENKVKRNWWLCDNKYRYVWLLIGKDETGIEKIFYACNDKIWINKIYKQSINKERYFDRFSDIKIVKLPFEYVSNKVIIEGNKVNIYQTNNLKDNFKLYCPIELNEKYHVYADCYKEIEPDIKKIDGFEFKTRKFKWVPPKMLGE